MSDQHASAHAQHDDDRIEALREEYGENANLTIDELRRRAEDDGFTGTSNMTKTELLDAIGREHRH